MALPSRLSGLFGTVFLKILQPMFSLSYETVTVDILWINRQRDFLFWDTRSAMLRLLIRPGGIGDFIVSLPALERLKTGYLEVWAASPNVPLARFADCARPIAATGLDLLGIAEPRAGLIDELRGFDSIVSWYGANRPEFRQLTSDLGLPFTFLPALPPGDARIHATDFYLEQVSGITHGSGDGATALLRSRLGQGLSIPRIRCEVRRGDFAVIHPFSGNPKKNWPLEKFQALARRLKRCMPVRWCAGPEDPPLQDCVRITDLYELACWLASARLYIGNDSGITHLAAAAGAPVLALFGPTDPEVWAPRGPNVRVYRWK
jgi:hypothetical protein